MSMLADIRLETPRLLLRPPGPEDFDAFAEAMADPEGMRYLGGVQPRATAWRQRRAALGP